MPSVTDQRLVKIVAELENASEDQIQAIERVLRLRAPSPAADLVDQVIAWEEKCRS
jgi:hypothetical protein